MTRVLLALLLSLLSAPVFAADAPGARTIVLVRHGHYAPDPDADARLGPGLSPLGVLQARRVGGRLAKWPVKFDATYVSPLQRARDTAKAIEAQLAGSRFQVEDDLAECTPPTRRADIMVGEKAEDLAACRAQLERLFATHFKPSAGGDHSELMVCHGNVIRYLVTRALGVDPTAWLGFSAGHASITRIRIEADGRMQVLSVGDVGHLPSRLQTGATGDAEAAALAAVAAP